MPLQRVQRVCAVKHAIVATLLLLFAATAVVLCPPALADDIRTEGETKTLVPTLVKQVEHDGAWAPATVVSSNETTRWRLQVRLPDALPGEGAYPLTVVDEPFDAEGLPSVMVRFDAADGTTRQADPSSYEASVRDGRLSVAFEDVLAANPGLAGGETMVVEYSQPGWMPDSAPLGQDGAHANTAWVEYEGGRSVAAMAQAVSVALVIDKVDATTLSELEGAAFAIEGPDGRYLTRSGAWDDEAGEAARFATGRDGRVTVKGLAPGAYIIRELDAPATYQPLEEGFQVEIAAHMSSAGNLAIDVAAAAPAVVEKVDPASGTVVVRVPNVKDGASARDRSPVATGASGQGGFVAVLSHTLPQTGREAFSWLAFVAMVAAMLAVIGFKNARRDGETDRSFIVRVRDKNR